MRYALVLFLAMQVGDLSWMAGHWRSIDGGVETEEIWLAPRGGLMTGMSRTVKDGRASAFEFIRIQATKDGIVYFAQPGGRPPTPFTLVESKGKRAVFTNPEHDFPKRIIYWRDGAKLCARTEGADGEGEQWCWERVTPALAAPAAR